MTRSTCSASRSVILPLPSSPHWAPMITMPAIGPSESTGTGAGAGSRPAFAPASTGGRAPPRRLPAVAAEPDRGRLAVALRRAELDGRGGRGRQVLRQLHLAPLVGAEERQRVAAHLHEAGNGALGDLVAQARLVEVRRQHDGLLVLVAGVDDRVELLED